MLKDDFLPKNNDSPFVIDTHRLAIRVLLAYCLFALAKYVFVPASFNINFSPSDKRIASLLVYLIEFTYLFGATSILAIATGKLFRKTRHLPLRYYLNNGLLAACILAIPYIEGGWYFTKFSEGAPRSVDGQILSESIAGAEETDRNLLCQLNYGKFVNGSYVGSTPMEEACRAQSIEQRKKICDQYYPARELNDACMLAGEEHKKRNT